ncbi:MAG: CRISPR-associated helicase Cas3' [Deltaproteobacteria bacterium]|nr:CRISPR-associated helicase Cas3' [Deltaproteobacteria bacterium]
MAKILHPSNLYSHPDKLLEDHLLNVSNLILQFISEKPHNIQKELKEIAVIIGLAHDLGKATNYFQEYLLNKDIKQNKHSSHSFLSAICAFNLSKEIKYLDTSIIEPHLFPLAAFLSVKRHHGDLRDVSFEIIFEDEDEQNLKDQIENINYNNFSIVIEKLFGVSEKINKEKLLEWINNFSSEIKSYRKEIRHLNKNIKIFLIINFLFSLLLDADKSDVVIKDSGVFKRKQLFTAGWVDSYKSKTTFDLSDINEIREKAYQEAIKNITRNIANNKKIYSLNLPTGIGKTLIAFSYALKLKEKLKKDNLRIIYALPYLSVIDQNSNIFESIIKSNGIPAYSDILIKHHHLSEIYYKKDDFEFETDEAKILVEGWNAEIIITTFMQLFYTLISNKNRSIRKFHRISNSIVILDEIQSIPTKYWNILRIILSEISDMLNVYIILSTATEPLIFGKDEVLNIVDKTFYFNKLNRISLSPLLDKSMTLAELSDYFFDITNDINSKVTNENTYLFIFNTISSAKEFYYLLIEKYKIQSITYLSTHLTPAERLKRIAYIKKGKYKLVVSTQLVEAGVDIDFDVVVRDFAPLDSINQSSGRCNRNGKNKGNVYIVNLVDEQGKLYSSYVYDIVLLNITQNILINKKEIKESEFLDLTNTYYNEIKNKKLQDNSISEAIYKLRYDSIDHDKISISDFKLIENDYPKIDVFVETDEKARSIWKKYNDIKNIENKFERKDKFDSMKADFYNYVISIPNNIENSPPMVGELGYIGKSILKDYYDIKTGFITKNVKSAIIW